MGDHQTHATKTWKPTKAGTYRLGGREIAVRCDAAGLYHEQSTNPELFGAPVKIHDHATWSLLTPGWQPGAPTDAQLRRWRWWAIIARDSRIIAHLVCGNCSLPHGVLVVGMSAMDPSLVFRSAPIQPDLSNGPLWVPLEVCK